MRKVGLVLSALCVIANANLKAQALTVSTEAGVSATQLATPAQYWGSRTGYLVGAFASVSFTPWLAVQAGIRLHEKGAAVPGDFEMRIRYVEFPVLARLSVGSTHWPIRPLAMLGVARATELSCTAQERPFSGYLQASPPPVQPMQPIDCVSWRTDLYDLGVVAAGGVEVRLGRLRAAVVGQYTRGTHNIASGYNQDTPSFWIYNRATSIVLSVGVPLWERRPSNRRLQRTGR
jgi:hypothetical protein